MKIRIEQDEMPHDTPRDWENLGEMICFHGRYNLGDKDHDYRDSDYSGWEEMEEAIQKEEDAAVILPIFMYDHGGITVSTSPFSCNFDSGRVGLIFVSKEKVRKEYGWKRITNNRIKKITEYLEGEVKTYDQYLTGDVWGFIIEDDEGEHLESCWGFYGREYCEKEAQDVLEHLQNEEKENAAELRRVQASMPCCHV